MGAGLAAVMGTGWASGVNLYGTVLLLGVFGRLELAPVPDALTATPVIVVAAIAYLIELVADKVPYLDNIWDVVHTAVRPLGAAVVGALLAGDADISGVLGATTSGGIALASHATKASARVAVNTSPEPVSNIAVSVFEDGLVAGMVWLVVEQPVIAGILAVVLLVAGAGLMVMLWRLIRTGITKLRNRRNDPPPSVRPAASPGGPTTNRRR